MQQESILQFRRDTPGASERIHFNNAGCSLPVAATIETLTSYIEKEARTGGYETARDYTAALDQVYSSVAKLINASPDEIAFTESATRAWDTALYSIPFKKGDIILTGGLEYVSNNIGYAHLVNRFGVEIQSIPEESNGEISITALQNRIDSKVKLIGLTHIATNNGIVQPAAAVGAVAKAAGIPYLLDACQSVGHVPVDVQEIGCDFLSATGRKYLRGPRGTGFLYVRKAMLEKTDPPFLDMHAAQWIGNNEYTIRPDAKRFESWEYSAALRLAMGTAIDYAIQVNPVNYYPYIESLANYLRERLQQIPGIALHHFFGKGCGIITFTTPGFDCIAIRDALFKRNINVSATGPLEGYWQDAKPPVPSLVRASLHYYNTTEEVDLFIQELEKVLATLR